MAKTRPRKKKKEETSKRNLDRMYSFRGDGQIIDQAIAEGLNVADICRHALKEAVEQKFCPLCKRAYDD